MDHMHSVKWITKKSPVPETRAVKNVDSLGKFSRLTREPETVFILLLLD